MKKYTAPLPLVEQLLAGEKLNLVDVGARNGFWGLRDFAPVCDVIGFEPNPAEYEKVVERQTDRQKAMGLEEPLYHSIQYSDKAISDRIGKAILNIPKQHAAASLLEVDFDLLSNARNYVYNEWLQTSELETTRTEEVETTTLDQVAKQHCIQQIDFLKLDTEGTELSCLRGGKALLESKRIGVIKTEVVFLPTHHNSPTFSDIDQFLQPHGFMLLDFELTPVHRVKWTDYSFRPDQDRGTVFFADAYYAMTREEYAARDPKDALKHALVVADLGFTDYAIALLQQTPLVEQDHINKLYEWWSRDTRTWKTRFREATTPVLKKIARMLPG
jgi:FkbM family methyltransferase